jgi:nucleoside recognition membrane protein YjiH
MGLLTTTIINITSENMSDMLGWTTLLIDELKPFWILIVGILLGVTVIMIIIRAIRGSKD